MRSHGADDAMGTGTAGATGDAPQNPDTTADLAPRSGVSPGSAAPARPHEPLAWHVMMRLADDRGLSQCEVAGLLGLDERTVRRLEARPVDAAMSRAILLQLRLRSAL